MFVVVAVVAVVVVLVVVGWWWWVASVIGAWRMTNKGDCLRRSDTLEMSDLHFKASSATK